jgi:hypothetical protein
MALPRLLRALIVTLRIRRRDPNAAWFRTQAWQRCEREADSDLADGRFEDFRCIDDAIASLNAASTVDTGADPIAIGLRRARRSRRP